MNFNFVAAALVLTLAGSASAQNPFEKLPFGIIIGKTPFKDIQGRGVCSSTNTTSSCNSLLMAGGKFRVNASQTDVVNELIFKPGGDFPQAWKDVGLKMRAYAASSSPAAPRGTSKADFLKLLKSLKGVENVAELVTSVGAYEIQTQVSFDVGSNHFDALFAAQHGRSEPADNFDQGLISLRVTESF